MFSSASHSSLLLVVVSALFLVVLLLPLCFVVVVDAAQPYPVWYHHCHGKLDEMDWRYVLLYQQSLLQSKKGKQFLSSLRECMVEHDSEKVNQHPHHTPHIRKLLDDPEIEEERKNLHMRSAKAFQCVDTFERKAAADEEGPGREWHQPFDHDEKVPGGEVEHNPEDHDEEGRGVRNFDNWNHEEMMHPEDFPH